MWRNSLGILRRWGIEIISRNDSSLFSKLLYMVIFVIHFRSIIIDKMSWRPYFSVPLQLNLDPDRTGMC